jgi:hypothetical protein
MLQMTIALQVVQRPEHGIITAQMIDGAKLAKIAQATVDLQQLLKDAYGGENCRIRTRHSWEPEFNMNGGEDGQ